MRVQKKFHRKGWEFPIRARLVDNDGSHSVCLIERGGDAVACWGEHITHHVRLEGSKLLVGWIDVRDVPAGPFETAACESRRCWAIVQLSDAEVKNIKAWLE